ncbi:MAG TPA: cupredoxin domain-containing protein [Acidimicrobiia bacterium]|nr:cupredoxin domain-containing protein [Acidimicrobiia bacterium]
MSTSKRSATTLALLMVTVLACGGEGETATGSPSTTTPAASTAAAGEPTLTIEGRSFGQAPEVAAGESFTIVNRDSARHTFTSSDGSWEEVDLPGDSEVPFTVPAALAPGRYVFFCAIHSDMGGSLTVAG